MTNHSFTFARNFNPDTIERAAVALHMETEQHAVELPVHTHHKGQLVMALHGAVACRASDTLWMVPPQHAVWIPGDTPHSNRATANARIFFLFIDPRAVTMPDNCCTLSISPMISEMIQYLATEPLTYEEDGATARLVAVLLEQLAKVPATTLHLPLPAHTKLRQMTEQLIQDPGNRRTLASWAQQLAMSDRTLARLINHETGLTFGRWRQQLHLMIALHQLAGGESVQRVAGNLGYDSVTAFITMFKKALGKSPTQYFSALQQISPKSTRFEKG